MQPHKLFPTTAMALALLFATPFASGEEKGKDEAQTIIEKADAIRFPKEGFQVEITIVSHSPDKEPEERKYRVLSRGNENTVVITTEPADERGQSMLMKGHDLWMFLPAVSQPIRLPLAQRLTGQVAN